MNLANQLTLFRLLLIPVFVYFATITNLNIFELPVFCLAALTDFLDGFVARKYNLITTFGKFMDPLADKLLTTAAFLILVERGIIPAWSVIVILAREFMITGFRVLAASKGVTIAASMWGKVKTVSQFVSIVLFLLDTYFSFHWGLLIRIYYFSVAMTILSAVDYLKKNIDVLELDNV